MKSHLRSICRKGASIGIVRKAVAACLAPALLLAAAFPLRADDATNTLEIQSVRVAGKSLPFRDKDSISLGSTPQGIVFHFGPATNSKPPLRLRYMLEGFEGTWHEPNSEMSLNVRFFNSSGDQISQNIYHVSGESTGWTGSLKTSSLTHRRETLVVPPQATRLLIVISSAGPPETVGIFVVANLVVSKSDGKLGNVVLLQSPFENDHGEHPNDDDPPAGWIHDGTRPSMAKVVKFGQDPQTRAFAIVDIDQASHGEWHNLLESAPAVKPGDSLVVEWNEMYSMGSGNVHDAYYAALPANHYKFHVRGLDVMGAWTGGEASIRVFVPEPFWKTPWFWAAALAAIVAMILGASRYFVWQRMRREMARLKQQRALEQERLRIAHDIHDDLGARVTQISLLSAMAQENPAFPEKARADFDKVSKMSRELVSALYETVWAVNPENDNLEALGNYVCQMVKQLCEQTPLRCRFHVMDLPPEIQVSSQTRHNISLAVKEAVHNIIKHAKASEVTIRMVFADGSLEVTVHDDGAGFQPGEGVSGHGLSNMKQRLQNIGGSCTVESKPGGGTTVRLSLRIGTPVPGA
ncbi:MAG TPA: sensor histidine kinase [Verrucomicrobiae bacterium]|jgi:signal transduction histidine kinase|nr:sensor histidine kinase [Verrucomicrobiae bacterium]